MGTDAPCIEIRRPYSDVVQLAYFPGIRVVEIDGLLKDAFTERDNVYGLPLGKRREEKGNCVEYNFSLVHFAEAFLGRYQIDYLGSFLRRNMFDEDPSDVFIQRLNNLKNQKRAIIINTETLLRGRNQIYRIMPVNFETEELNEIFDKMPKSWFSKYTSKPVLCPDFTCNKPPKRSIIDSGHGWKNLKKLRKALLGLEDPIILSNGFRGFGVCELENDFEFIDRYNIDTSKLEVVLRSTQ